jgi:ribosomal protein S18 acetylase RimI-like enzyme
LEIKTTTLQDSEIQQIVQLYHQVWGGNPDDIFERFERHTTYPGFQGVVALEAKNVVGFAYGYTSTPGQYYHELLKRALSTAHQSGWLENTFEIAELAVHPSKRRTGLGKRLVENLMKHTSNQMAILTTQINNLPARKLYEQLDWKIIQQNFKPSETAEPYVIMGKKLIP